MRMSSEGIKIEGEPSKRYRLSYGGLFIGSFDTAKEAIESYDKHNEVIRPVIYPGINWRYDIRDGKKEITIGDLRRVVEAEE